MSTCATLDGVGLARSVIVSEGGTQSVCLDDGKDLILLYQDEGCTFKVEQAGRFKMFTVTEPYIGTKLSKVISDWPTSSILPCVEANRELQELIQKAQTSGWSIRDPTQDELDDHLGSDSKGR